jgi:hypothetical protein
MVLTHPQQSSFARCYAASVVWGDYTQPRAAEGLVDGSSHRRWGQVGPSLVGLVRAGWWIYKNYYSTSYLLQSMSMYIYIYRYYKSWYVCTQSDEAPRTDLKGQPISWWVINDQSRYSMVPPSCKMVFPVFPINYRYIYHKAKWNWSFCLTNRAI